MGGNLKKKIHKTAENSRKWRETTKKILARKFPLKKIKITILWKNSKKNISKWQNRKITEKITIFFFLNGGNLKKKKIVKNGGIAKNAEKLMKKLRIFFLKKWQEI